LIGSNARTGQQILWTNPNDFYMEEDILYAPNLTAQDTIATNYGYVTNANDVEVKSISSLYHTYGNVTVRNITYEEDSSTGEMSVSSSTDVIKLDANLKTITVNSKFADRYSELSVGSVYFRDGTSRAILYGDSLMFT
jgi:hypothetical protein